MYPSDFTGPDITYSKKGIAQGSMYEIGDSQDDWGCRFTNIHRGVHGEVKEPIVSPDDEEWADTSRIHIPVEWLSFEIDDVNRFCASTGKFVMSGCCARPFEQLQFIRGSEQLFVDLAMRPAGLFDFIGKMHQFYCELLEKWAKTDVDALNMMDDWGAQRGLLISPDTWVEIFKPLYKDYIGIARRNGKKIFMHSDGDTLAIYPHLIELGLDAFNSQIFCVGIDKLAAFRGKITFWGEIDRQHLLPEGNPAQIHEAVIKVHENLWHNGGCIAQCEFGPGAKPENVRQVFASWDELTGNESK
jgi:uroporphyrinogen-III decarboxylase